MVYSRHLSYFWGHKRTIKYIWCFVTSVRWWLWTRNPDILTVLLVFYCDLYMFYCNLLVFYSCDTSSKVNFGLQTICRIRANLCGMWQCMRVPLRVLSIYIQFSPKIFFAWYGLKFYIFVTSTFYLYNRFWSIWVIFFRSRWLSLFCRANSWLCWSSSPLLECDWSCILPGNFAWRKINFAYIYC